MATHKLTTNRKAAVLENYWINKPPFALSLSKGIAICFDKLSTNGNGM